MEKKCIIDKVYERLDNGIVPTLLKFQNGNLTTERIDYCTMVDRTKMTKSKEALVVIDDQIYKGQINGTEQLADTYVAIRNKTTNKVRILPLDQASLKNCVFDELQKEDLTKKLLPLSEEANRKKLAKDFRGRKAATMYDTGEKMHVSVDIIKDDLDVTVQETEIQDDELLKLPESSLQLICPKCNKEAETLKEVYDMNNLIPTNILERLDSEANAVFEAKPKSLPIKSKYLLSCIENLKKDDQNHTETLYKIKIIIFMDSLYNFLKSKEQKIKDIELSGVTEKIEIYMRRTFLRQAFKNSTLCDKALCYYIVLCLLNSKDFSVDIGTLAEELEKSKTNVLTYAHLVNALPKSSQSDIVTLRLPKQVPAVKGAFKKRNRKR